MKFHNLVYPVDELLLGEAFDASEEDDMICEDELDTLDSESDN